MVQEERRIDCPNFKVGNTEIEFVTSFKYLGRILACENDDSLAMIHNIKKAKKVWGRMWNILKT